MNTRKRKALIATNNQGYQSNKALDEYRTNHSSFTNFCPMVTGREVLYVAD